MDLISWLEEPYTPIYIFKAKALAVFHTKFTRPPQFTDFIDDLKGLTHHEILQQTFVDTHDDNPFANSGYRPYKLVCSYIWKRK